MHSTGERLVKGRKQKGLSLKEVANSLDLTESEVSLIEDNQREATPYEIEQFANLYELNPDYILKGNAFKDDRDNLTDAFKSH